MALVDLVNGIRNVRSGYTASGDITKILADALQVLGVQNLKQSSRGVSLEMVTDSQGKVRDVIVKMEDPASFIQKRYKLSELYPGKSLSAVYVKALDEMAVLHQRSRGVKESEIRRGLKVEEAIAELNNSKEAPTASVKPATQVAPPEIHNDPSDISIEGTYPIIFRAIPYQGPSLDVTVSPNAQYFGVIPVSGGTLVTNLEQPSRAPRGRYAFTMLFSWDEKESAYVRYVKPEEIGRAYWIVDAKGRPLQSQPTIVNDVTISAAFVNPDGTRSESRLQFRPIPLGMPSVVRTGRPVVDKPRDEKTAAAPPVSRPVAMAAPKIDPYETAKKLSDELKGILNTEINGVRFGDAWKAVDAAEYSLKVRGEQLSITTSRSSSMDEYKRYSDAYYTRAARDLKDKFVRLVAELRKQKADAAITHSVERLLRELS